MASWLALSLGLLERAAVRLSMWLSGSSNLTFGSRFAAVHAALLLFALPEIGITYIVCAEAKAEAVAKAEAEAKAEAVAEATYKAP
ncbi:hypothetical protein COHA_002818 [Chlorella ohadii]|uniref:Uncharacterized protein n=1 Tax=Chlorella ohadii TaxID=2649997 RepID=A0AAD5H4J0_9CHLO|nr:hypothetical protein COHA_002818 [Chlorella ohadii]